MQITTVLGVLVGAITLVGGMILKGANPIALVNPAALVIIFVGTTAALLNAFPMNQFKNIGTMFRMVFFSNQKFDREQVAKDFVKYSHTVRKEGLLVLENVEFEDSFMQIGISLIVDGTDEKVVDEVLQNQIESMESRHKLGATMFAQAGMYAPTLGVLGAVIGLVAALGNLSDIDALGHSIAAAFVATLFGIFTGYVLWHPFSNKLKQLNREEVEIKQMMLEGIKALQAGDGPNIMQIKMLAFIPDKRKKVLLKEWGK